MMPVIKITPFPRETTEEEVARLVARIAQVEFRSVELVKYRSNNPGATDHAEAFVRFYRNDVAERAIEALKGCEAWGSKLQIERAEAGEYDGLLHSRYRQGHQLGALLLLGFSAAFAFSGSEWFGRLIGVIVVVAVVASLFLGETRFGQVVSRAIGRVASYMLDPERALPFVIVAYALCVVASESPTRVKVLCTLLNMGALVFAVRSGWRRIDRPSEEGGERQ